MSQGSVLTRVLLAIVALILPTFISAQAAKTPGRVALYASVGEELTTYGVDVNGATLTRQGSFTLPGFVQEAWAPPSGAFLYVAWSNGGASYNGTGVTPVGDKHGITAFRIDPASGQLRPHGMTAALRARPIHITGDVPGTHLLVAYNDPSGVSVHAINRDGSIGSEVAQPARLDVGIYAHQVRVMPTNRNVIVVTRGNEPTATTKEDPGALKLFRYENGRLTNTASIAPDDGRGFRSRHLDFHPTRPWIFLSVEAQNRLDLFTIQPDGGLSARPAFSKNTLAGGRSGVIAGQTTSTVHVHPNGRFVYVANRASGTVQFRGTQVLTGGSNDIAVFRLNESTGEPTLVQNADTHGITPRTFSLDPSARLLVVGNQMTLPVRDGDAVKTVPANLAVFRIREDGMLDFARRYEVGVARKPLWWMGMVGLAE